MYETVEEEDKNARISLTIINISWGSMRYVLCHLRSNVRNIEWHISPPMCNAWNHGAVFQLGLQISQNGGNIKHAQPFDGSGW